MWSILLTIFIQYNGPAVDMEKIGLYKSKTECQYIADQLRVPERHDTKWAMRARCVYVGEQK